MVEHLPSKHEALSPNPSTRRKKRKKERRKERERKKERKKEMGR
jgi:hypothetical protein